MAHFFRTMGRLTGYAIRSHAFDRAISKAGSYLLSEMRLADIKLKLKLLKQKRTRHLRLLGKTVYNLYINDVEPLKDEHTQTIIRVLREIDMEIEEVDAELQRRKQQEKNWKKQKDDNDI